MGWTAEQAEAEWQKSGSLPVSEEAEVADADEAWREQMQQEAAQELVDRQAHDALLVAVRGVSPAEADLAVGEGNQPAVGDADAMGVSAEIAQGVLRAAEGSLGIDDPVVTEQDSEPGGEAAWLGERCELAVELELALVERRLETGDELATEDTSEHLDWKEEGSSGRDPDPVIRGQTSSGDDAVNMGMMLQSLIPGVEHAEEADLRTQVPRVASDFEQCGGTGAEQQTIDEPLVLKRNRSQFTRQREDGMHIARRQQLAFALL